MEGCAYPELSGDMHDVYNEGERLVPCSLGREQPGESGYVTPHYRPAWRRYARVFTTLLYSRGDQPRVYSHLHVFIASIDAATRHRQ